MENCSWTEFWFFDFYFCGALLVCVCVCVRQIIQDKERDSQQYCGTSLKGDGSTSPQLFWVFLFLHRTSRGFLTVLFSPLHCYIDPFSSTWAAQVGACSHSRTELLSLCVCVCVFVTKPERLHFKVLAKVSQQSVPRNQRKWLQLFILFFYGCNVIPGARKTSVLNVNNYQCILNVILFFFLFFAFMNVLLLH